jgi:predicted lipid-binding transport protein (Tim44 family)
MPQARSSADRLVFRAISATEAASRCDRQELPQIDLIGAAIARAARLAAAEHRARRAYAMVQRSQAAELLRAARDAAHAARDTAHAARNAAGDGSAPSFADLAKTSERGEGAMIPPTARSGGFVWRFHPAPDAAGAPIASSTDGAPA